MTDDLNVVHSVSFPEAGEGVELLFRNSDKLALQKEFGPTWMQFCINQLEMFDMVVLQKCFEVGGKKEGKPHKILLDDVKEPLNIVCEKVADALCLAIHNKKYKEFVEFLLKEIEERGKQGDDAVSDPPQIPDSGSANSGGLLSG